MLQYYIIEKLENSMNELSSLWSIHQILSFEVLLFSMEHME